MEDYCIMCWMPLDNKEDIWTEIKQWPVCFFCINEDKTVKTCEEIFEWWVDFFEESVPWADRELAEKIVRRNMCNLCFWDWHESECLIWEQATDEEFQEAIASLQD